MTTSSSFIVPPPTSSVWGAMRSRMFGLTDKDVAPLLLFFTAAPAATCRRLTDVVESFVTGYNLAMASEDIPSLTKKLDAGDKELAGFVWEGAGMGMALRTLMMPGNRGFASYLEAANRHHYIVHIGAGWAMARFPMRHAALKQQLCPTYHWLAWDGYGFHESFFRTDHTLVEHKGRPANGFAGNAFDQGVGRALWFVLAANPTAIADRIAAFDSDRHADLWSGIGLAITYAGGVSDDVVDEVIAASGEHHDALKVGSALAAHTRTRAGNPTERIHETVKRITGVESSVISSFIKQLEAAAKPGDATYPELREQLRTKLPELAK